MSDVKPVAWAAFEGSELICVHHDCDKCIELARLAMAPNKPTFDVAPLTTGLTLQAEIEALRKDAERYKWLRSRMPGAAYRVEGIIYSQGGSGVDAGIDAAIAKEKQQESLK